MPVPLLVAQAWPSYEGPPALTAARVFTQWSVEPYLLAGLVVVAGLYLAGVARLTRRGDHWGRWRTASFIGLGLGTIALSTMSSLGVYDDTLFSMHVAQHMLLSMIAPVFLALGAPITLALRALHGRLRAGLLAALHSVPARVLSSPLVGFPLLVGTPFALYFTGLYPLMLQNAALHELLHVHFVLVGCIFFWPLLGLDPLPGRLPYPLRMVVAFLALPFHAFLGVAVMGSNTVLAGDYYRSLHLPWRVDLLADQSTGGGILWGSGDLVGLVFLGALAIQWMRADEREAERVDRQLDRAERADQRADHDAREEAELAAYNAQLAALAAREASHRGR